MKNVELLKQGNGRLWMTDDNRVVPKKCPKCGADMGVFIKGEPVFLCKGKNRHYYGTVKFPEE